jgi:Transposase, Mutator family
VEFLPSLRIWLLALQPVSVRFQGRSIRTRRDLRGKNFVYLWVDGVHFGVRLEDASQCILVVIGATANGKKELLAMLDGYRESTASWQEQANRQICATENFNGLSVGFLGHVKSTVTWYS